MKHSLLPRSAKSPCAVLLFVAALLLPSGRAAATGLSVPVGLVFENNFYPQFGVRASVAHDLILKAHPRFTVSFTTNRLSAAIGRNVVKQDNVHFNLGWYFRPGKLVDPYAGLDAGFTRYNRENIDLFALLDENNSSLYVYDPVLNIRVGLTSSLLGGKLRPSIDGGLSVSSLAGIGSPTVNPLFFRIGIDFDIAKGVLP